jgi:hypothetical protein
MRRASALEIPEQAAMSQRVVGIVIDRLLTEQQLRVQFALDRIEWLANLGCLGLELTPDEIDLFFQTDERVWFWYSAVMGDQVH